MSRSRRAFSIVAAAAFSTASLALVPPSALASGGSIVSKNDGVGIYDGLCLGYTSDGSVQEYVTRFRAGELDPTAIGVPGSTIVCGSHLWVYSFDPGPAVYHGACVLRPEDPANPGYPDFTATIADDPAAGVYPPGYSDSFAVFGGGAGVAIDGTATVFLSWIHPGDQPPGSFFVCPMQDTTNPAGASNDSLIVTSGTMGKDTIADWQMDLTVFQTSPVNARFSAHGSQRFPGDKGNSIVYSQRPNSGAAASDDTVSFTLVLDNDTGAPFSADVKIEADRSGALPPLGKGFKDITGFFAPKIASPVVLPVGRTVINGSLKRPVKPAFYSLMPIQLPGRVTVSEAGSGLVADTESDVWGLRNYAGQYDAGTDEVASLVNTPSLPGDVVAVQFRAIDLPSTADYLLSGTTVVGAEFGGSGLPGFDYVELREEDPILVAPNDSPSGLLRSVGANDGVGEIPVGGGGVAVARTVNFVPDLLVPVSDPTFTTTNYWIKVGIRPGDDFATSATAVVMDNQAATRQGTSYFVSGGGSPVYSRIGVGGIQNFNAEVRLELDGQSGTLPGSGAIRPARRPAIAFVPGAAPARADWRDHIGR